MNKENIEEFKNSHAKVVSTIMHETGEFLPMIGVLVEVEENKELKIVLCPIPPELTHSEKAKDLIKPYAHSFLERLVKEGNKPMCFFISFEAWLRRKEYDKNLDLDLQREEALKNWKELPKVEVITSFFETAESSETEFVINYVKRTGKAINSEGELMDVIELEKDEEMSGKEPNKVEGRFANILGEFLSRK